MQQNPINLNWNNSVLHSTFIQRVRDQNTERIDIQEELQQEPAGVSSEGLSNKPYRNFNWI